MGPVAHKARQLGKPWWLEAFTKRVKCGTGYHFQAREEKVSRHGCLQLFFA